MDVGGWLRSLGLGQYEAAFRKNEINERVLPSLTQEDLKEIGVGPVGHRRVLLDAIATLRAEANAKASSADMPPSSRTRGTPPDDRAERRQVTVMFSDLVGSTALSARMDPEDLREVISVYQKCVTETVARFGGFVAKFMGDGVLIYFGYPQAHEDDAERAVRAGLALIAAVSDLKTHAPLQARVGIATGLVVVGDLIGSGASQEQVIVGETPNLAARLQSIAEPNSVAIAESTRRLVGNLFELGDLGAKDLKGITAPVRAWAALRAASVESRFEAMHASGLTELVGREEEIELLLRRWSKAKTGEGQVVLLSGEPGIGKSRLTAALLDRVAGEPHARLRYFCSPQHTDSALYPIISQMERAAGFTHEDTAQAKLDKLDALLAQSFTSHQDAALLAEMLSLPNDGRYPTLQLMPQQRRQKTLEALAAQLAALSQSKPMLMIFEDVHWIDPTSLEALTRTVDQVRTLGVLLVVTFRPEFEPQWIGQPHVTGLTVSRLGHREIAAMIDRVVGNKALAASIRQVIVERTDGIPLFIEEMTKAVLEAGGEEAAQRSVGGIPSASVAVPASLHASLMGRLDRLGWTKELAQISAVLGPEFSQELLTLVTDMPPLRVEQGLKNLVEMDFLVRRHGKSSVGYAFRHALVQDVAYSSLLHSRRRLVHGRVAEVLRETFPHIAESQPEVVARHMTEARLLPDAVKWWRKAGHRSVRASSNPEAIEHFSRCLQLLEQLTEGPDRTREELEIRIDLGVPLFGSVGYMAPEFAANFNRALELSRESNDAAKLFPALWAQWTTTFSSGDMATSEMMSLNFLRGAELQESRAMLVIGHRIHGMTTLSRGDVRGARRELERSLSLYRDPDDNDLTYLYGQNQRIAALSYLCLAMQQLGYLDQALALSNQAIADATALGHFNTQGYCLAQVLRLHMLRRDPASIHKTAQELAVLSEQHSATSWSLVARIALALTDAAGSVDTTPLETVRTGIQELQSRGWNYWVPWLLLEEARALLARRDYGPVKRRLDEAQRLIETNDHRLVSQNCTICVLT
jgi:class 3 adenylate cyclase